MTIVDDFLAEDQNRDHCSGIIGSGNKNFAQDYCFTAYLLGDRYQIPVLYCYEFQGTDQDIIKVKELININGKRSSL